MSAENRKRRTASVWRVTRHHVGQCVRPSTQRSRSSTSNCRPLGRGRRRITLQLCVRTSIKLFNLDSVNATELISRCRQTRLYLSPSKRELRLLLSAAVRCLFDMHGFQTFITDQLDQRTVITATLECGVRSHLSVHLCICL